MGGYLYFIAGSAVLVLAWLNESIYFTDRCYQTAKQSLHTAKPDHLVGRDQEVAEITGFLKTHLDKQSAGSLYISGAPGTGKTAALLHIIDDFKVGVESVVGMVKKGTRGPYSFESLDKFLNLFWRAFFGFGKMYREMG